MGLSAHVKSTNHKLYFLYIKIIHKENSKLILGIPEAIHINVNRDSLVNFRNEGCDIEIKYSDYFKKISLKSCDAVFFHMCYVKIIKLNCNNTIIS